MDKSLLKCLKEIHTLLDTCGIMLLDDFKSLMKYDLKTKEAILLALVQKQKKITASEIAQQLDVTPSAVSQMLKKLEKEGFIKREINPQNRREIFVTLHTQGHLYFEDHQQMELILAEKYYSKLGEEDIQQMHRIVKRLHQIIAEEKRTANEK